MSSKDVFWSVKTKYKFLVILPAYSYFTMFKILILLIVKLNARINILLIIINYKLFTKLIKQ